MVMSKGVLSFFPIINHSKNQTYISNQPWSNHVQLNHFLHLNPIIYTVTRYLATQRPITSLGIETFGDHTSTVSPFARSTHWKFQWFWAISPFEWYLKSWVSLASNLERSWPFGISNDLFYYGKPMFCCKEILVWQGWNLAPSFVWDSFPPEFGFESMECLRLQVDSAVTD